MIDVAGYALERTARMVQALVFAGGLEDPPGLGLQTADLLGDDLELPAESATDHLVGLFDLFGEIDQVEARRQAAYRIRRAAVGAAVDFRRVALIVVCLHASTSQSL